ncbi:MAG: thioredoxin 1 [Planctomycetota bacterium]|jgi:thioredoxin 1
MSTAAEVTDNLWESVVLKSEVPVLVDFWAEWCAPCRAMGPFVDKLAEELDGRLKVVKINTQDNPEVPARYGITAIPTFLVIKDGEVAKQIVGQRGYADLKAEVEPFL